MSAISCTYRYRLPARVLHWIMAFAIPCQIYLGWASELATVRETNFRLIVLHFQLGVTLAALIILRLAWRIAYGAPPTSPGERTWPRHMRVLTHRSLYVLLLLLPPSGYVMWVWMEAPIDVFGLFELPRVFSPPAEDETGRAIAWYVHYWSAWVLIALASLHIAAALWHQFVRRDELISQRML